jgi:serine/threonine protein kinase
MRYAREIVSAIEYMHMRNTVHRDIKPENVCLAGDDTCRLIDFGHAAFLQVLICLIFSAVYNFQVSRCLSLLATSANVAYLTSQDCRQDDYIGTVPYMAFELLLSENRPAIDYRQTDMWAFGATIFVMCTGKFPWREATLGDKEFACYATGGAGTRYQH